MLLQDILALAETQLSDTSSAAVCRKLSSVGRRVLSIESVSAFQGHSTISVRICECLEAAVGPTWSGYICVSTDGPEASWEARWQHPKPSLDHNPKDLGVDRSGKANGLSRQQVPMVVLSVHILLRTIMNQSSK